ncbi:MAG: pyridoxal 5'-phosphate synthase glutaminase subunit PdxT [Caldiserica bacterium CG02_land_8_20_14_3_00_36_38]|nr:pyridoxal 5'-phosphate synthase glutaminase subunit PdxT [Caldisericota bacterium]OIP13413.1 MAG: glutamine amidotransferase subunit PdxT [Caldisericum sp. CG2_30_36_11]PIP50036.1 MAG: pyridoxal 5'-phosphate synthase glutaminase subunit PdxT [Caldiserica bacterium CG23_combo_of_CG06-09_8_20_14_all_35_60]PIV55556.1 MAG: pyridoxal 5'-phosphate synthase glutaminase subunit PdxT [Caldiserica bacterium CG02_land_8_20_14_3_00_36_38]PIW11021.1 MAG: pyridoxal 5'-phosphate synthase glutaminase subuni
MKIGVLALQGDVSEHIKMIELAGANAVPVKTIENIKKIDGLIIPGGESTTIGKLIKNYKLEVIIKERINKGMPVYGTCTGMILLAKKIQRFEQFTFDILDITVVRNAFGRQVDSMEIDLDVKGFDSKFHAIFIRGPVAINLGPDVEVLSSIPEGAVFLRQNNILVSSFHPELGNDIRIHRYFLDMIKK